MELSFENIYRLNYLLKIGPLNMFERLINVRLQKFYKTPILVILETFQENIPVESIISKKIS